MTGLLVSVRDADEAVAALAGGAALIDIKEPARGSLGAADVAVWAAVAEQVRGARPLSVALGELLDSGVGERAACTTGMQYAKVGLSGTCHLPDWRARWREIRARLAPGVVPVAVIYADWRSVAAPPPEEVLDAAAELGCDVVLIDTFDKSRGDLFTHLANEDLRAIAMATQQRELALALAGSLAADRFRAALAYGPAWLAVRGAACEGGRTGRVSAERVRRLSSILARESAHVTANSRSLA